MYSKGFIVVDFIYLEKKQTVTSIKARQGISRAT